MNLKSKWLIIPVLILFTLFLTHIIVSHNNSINEKERFAKEVPKISISELDAGDLLFSRTGITNFIPGYWAHTAIFAGIDENGQAWILETKRGLGLKKNPIEQFLEREHVVVAKVKNVNKENKVKVVEWIKERLGLPFDYFYPTKNIIDEKYYCSEIIWAAYKQIGVDLDTNPGWTFKYLGGVAPQEMFEYSDLEVFRIK